MTLADIVFPAFLFIVGISIPLAFERGRLSRNTWAQLGHVLTRTLALLFMGLVQLNGERDQRLGGPIWETLGFIGLICTWVVVPAERGWRRNVFLGLKILGVVGLMVLLAIFRGEPHSNEIPLLGRVEGWVWFRTEWWGILGLIGWAYLTVAILWLILGRRREWLIGALACLILLHLAMERGGLFTRLNAKTWLGWSARVFQMLATAIDYLNQFVGLGGATGSLAAITMAGCLLGSILRRDSDVQTHRDRLRWSLTFVIGLLLAGFLTDTFEGINKIAATPTWCLWCAALTCLVWMILYRIMDVAEVRGWDILVRPAGANPLVAYFLHPITVGLIDLSVVARPLLDYKQTENPYVVGGGSLGMAFFVCVLTGLLARLGLRMRI
jgi:heparan-alpha-glucosaminide N-acetyltransferase